MFTFFLVVRPSCRPFNRSQVPLWSRRAPDLSTGAPNDPRRASKSAPLEGSEFIERASKNACSLGSLFDADQEHAPRSMYIHRWGSQENTTDAREWRELDHPFGFIQPRHKNRWLRPRCNPKNAMPRKPRHVYARLDPGVRVFAVAASLPGEICLTVGDEIDRRRFVSCIAKEEPGGLGESTTHGAIG